MLELKQGYQGFIARKAVEKKEDYWKKILTNYIFL